MIKSIAKIQIRSSLPNVYRIAETYPMFVSFFNKKKIVVSSPQESRVQVGMKRFGVDFEWEGSAKKNKNESIYFTQTKGLLRGLEANWLFRSESHSVTTVEIHTSFIYRALPIEFVLDRALVSKTTNRILKELKIASEK